MAEKINWTAFYNQAVYGSVPARTSGMEWRQIPEAVWNTAVNVYNHPLATKVRESLWNAKWEIASGMVVGGLVRSSARTALMVFGGLPAALVAGALAGVAVEYSKQVRWKNIALSSFVPTDMGKIGKSALKGGVGAVIGFEIADLASTLFFNTITPDIHVVTSQVQTGTILPETVKPPVYAAPDVQPAKPDILTPQFVPTQDTVPSVSSDVPTQTEVQQTLKESVIVPSGSSVWNEMQKHLTESLGHPPTDGQVVEATAKALTENNIIEPTRVMSGTVLKVETVNEFIKSISVPEIPMPVDLTNLPETVFLPVGSTPWEVSANLLESVGTDSSNGAILELTKAICVDSDIKVPNWGIEGKYLHTNLPTGFKLVFGEASKKVLTSLAR